MSERESSSESGAGRLWLPMVVLAMVCLLVRVQGLMALPIFGDEAIYLRWGQLIREGHAWISLIDPKPPLHFWLIALMEGWKDPLHGARMVSVIAGALSVPALFGACMELGRLGKGDRASGAVVGLIASLLMIFCPFVAFYQRLGTADALFMLEMLVGAWLSLRWARVGMASAGAGWRAAIFLGVLMGAAMLTRQGLSYALWALPVAAMMLHGRGARKRGRRFSGAVMQLLLAGVIALLLWAPYLTVDLQRFAAERGGMRAEVRTRILYQEQFTRSSQPRLRIVARNAELAFIPTWSDDQPIGGWFFLYMTWPLYFACLAGFIWLVVRRQWRILAMLVLWAGLMIGIPILLGNVLYSRYVVAGVLPLLIAGAFFLTELMGMALSVRPAVGWLLVLALLLAVLVLPFRELGRQARRWWEQSFTKADRYQYATGWTSGLATEKAIGFINGLSESGPVILITDAGWGLPADAMWVYLSKNPNVRLYYTSRSGEAPILAPAPGGGPNTFLLRKNKWLYTPAEPVVLPPDQSGPNAPVTLYVTNDPIHTAEGDVDAETFLRRLNPNLTPVETFYGIDKTSDSVELFELR